MPKKGKKGSSQKRGKSGKQTKKTPVQSDVGQPSTSAQEPESESEHEERTGSPEPDQGQTVQDTSFSTAKPPGIIVKKCEEIEKLAANIQEKFKITPNTNKQKALEQIKADESEELEYLVAEIKALAESVGFDIIPPAIQRPEDPIVFFDIWPYKWPNTKKRVPHIFVHPPINFKLYMRDIVSNGIQIYPPQLDRHYAKILTPTCEDHEELVKYLEDQDIPFHTFSYPSKKMMKVVIRGLATDVDIEKVKEEMIAASVPVVRLHMMNAKLCYKSKYKSITVIVPENDEGKKVLRVKKIFGRMVKVEPPLPRSKQCFRCQKWGHAQRYCRGNIRCVKCAGPHYSNDCTRDPRFELLKCANCGSDHTASYRQCPHCPDSEEYKEAQNMGKKKPKGRITRQVLTLDQCPAL